MAGITIVPTCFWVLGRLLLRSQLSILPSTAPRLDLRIKKMEGMLSKLYFTKRHPGLVVLFCLFSSAVGGCIAIHGESKHPVNFVNVVVGIALGLGYLVASARVIYDWASGQWEGHLDRSIRQTEERLMHLKTQVGDNTLSTETRVSQ